MKSIEMTPDQVERELVRLERLVGQIRGVQAQLVDEAERMRLSRSDGARSLKEWVAGRLDVASGTASDLVTVARSLESDDLSGEEDGVSFDRAVGRRKLAKAGASKEVLAQSDSWDIAGIRRSIASHRRMTRSDEQAAHEERRLKFDENDDGSSIKFWGRLPGVDGRTVRNTLERIADEVPVGPGRRGSRAQRLADALVRLCQGEATHSAGTASATVIVDARLAAPTNGEAGVTVLSGPRVGPQALEEILCTGTIEVIALTADGVPLGIGQSSRKVPPKLRNYVLARDGGCTVEGCNSTYRLEAHHIIERASHGPAEEDNLTTLCWFHHHVVIHRRGYTIDPDSPAQRIRFLPPSAFRRRGPP